MKPNNPLPCGHPASLLVQSVESDYRFCELCEARSERNDALKMEKHLGARVRILEAALRDIANPLLEDDIQAIRSDARAALARRPIEASDEPETTQGERNAD